MRVLWTVNTLNPKVGEVFGIKSSHAISWVEAMSEKIILNKNIELAIACPGNVKELLKEKYKGITYYIVPNNSKHIKIWNDVLQDFKPNIIHAYGTEKKHNLIVCNIAKNIPIIVSLQGILSEYQKHYYAGIDISKIIRYTPIRDIIRPSGFITGRRDYIMRAKTERLLLKKIQYVEGRSTWDRVSAMRINPKLKYYFCPRMLREPFYQSVKWDINNIRKHTIFVSQGNYPIKGLHFAFEALGKLKSIYPDVKLIISGKSFFDETKGIKRIKSSGYKRYLYDMAKELDIIDNIEFIGYQDAIGMTKTLRESHVALIPSSIENAPNSLAEAMIIGTPCIASYVGGNMDMMVHNQEGFLYCYNEPNMIVEYISRIFDGDKLACDMSKNSINTAENRHNPDKLVSTLIEIYSNVLKNVENNK